MIPVLPPQQIIHSTPQAAEIYQLDKSPLGDRQVLLLVHGLKDEKLRLFHWQHVIKYLNSDESFRKHYKIYLARWSTSAPAKKVAESFKPALRHLAEESPEPITIVSLSIGGNVVRDAMEDPQVDKSVSRLIALGAPFHGSPLFSKDWMQYGFYNHYKSPFTRMDRTIAYRCYFKIHPNLHSDYYWDNSDNQLPAIGPYNFRFPIAARGTLAPPKEPPPALSASQSAEKVTAYSGYIETRFIPNKRNNRVVSFFKSVGSFFGTTVPFHLGRQRGVIRALNYEMANLPTANKKQGVYALNDGITTVASSLSLPPGLATEVGTDDDESISKLRKQINIGNARIFKDIDHLTYLDGRRPFWGSRKIVDRLAPNEKPKTMFAWLLGDIMQKAPPSAQIVQSTTTDTTTAQP